MAKNKKELKEEESRVAKPRYVSGDVRVSSDANGAAPQQKTVATASTGKQQPNNSGWMRTDDGPVFVTSGRQIKTSISPSKAAYPGVYDIKPSEYAGAMQNLDRYNQKKEQGAPKSAGINEVESEGGKQFLNKWFPEKAQAGELPSEDEIRSKYTQLGAAQQDAYWMEWMANEAALAPLMVQDVEIAEYEKELDEAQTARDEALKLLGADAEKWATGNPTDYYERFGNEYRAEDYSKNDEAYLRYGDMDGIDLETAKRYSASPYIGRGRGYDLQRWAMTTPQQRDQYELLRNVYGQEEADNYLQSLQGELNRKLAGEEMELAQRYASEHPILSNAESVLTAPIRGAVAVDAMAEGFLSGNGIDNYDPRMNITRRADTIRGQTAQNLGGGKLAFLYQTLMSIGDNLANTAFWGGLNALPGGLGKLGLGSKAIQASMSGSAAASTFNDVVDRGGDNEQAMLAGTLSGIAEAVFEKYSIEGFLDLVTKEKGGKAVFDVLKQMGTEASEEGATEIANEIADRLVMGEKSKYETNVADMMAQGKTEGEARWAAALETAKEVGLSALGGGISGGVMGTAGTALNWAGRKISGENTQNRQESQLQEAQQDTQVEQTAEAEAEPVRVEHEVTGQRQQAEAEPMRVEREVTASRPVQEEQAVQMDAQTEKEPVRVEREITGKRAAAPNEAAQQEEQSTKPDTMEGQNEKTVKSPSKAEKGKTLRVERKVTVRRNGNTQSMDITGVEDVSNGNVFLRAKAENGETEIVSAGDVEFADPVQQELMEYKGINRMDSIGVRNYLDGYDGNLATPAQYAEAFESAYEDGKAGITYEKMLEMDVAARRYLTGTVRQAAYAAGERVNLQNAKGTKYQKIVTESLNRAIGGKIRFADEQIEGNGYYDPKTGEIVISRNADKGAYAYIAVHELGHKLKAENAEAWSSFRTLVEDALLVNDVDIDERISQTKELYSQRGQELTTEEALEEVICNSAASILQDEQIVRDMVNKDRTLMERVADFLREFVDKLSKAITGAGEDMSELGSWKQLQALKDDHENLQKIYQGLMSALEETDENHFRGDAEMVKMSVKEKNGGLATDTEGNTLTTEQQEYFSDSKVRDENGKLMVVYHGTPSGNYDQFRSSTYFTPMQWYADVYQSPSASSISYGKKNDAPKTFSAYLNITKPFDTRNAKERTIFQEKYYRKWGTGTPLSESGLPDWTDGMDLQDFIEENGYDYDGLILDEGGFPNEKGGVTSRGLSYVIFDPAQAKLTENKTPTSDERFRYSVRETNETVQEELKQTADAFEKVRYAHRITAAEADALAGRILKEANSVYERTQLAEEIAQIYSYVENAETVDMDHVDDMETALMARVMDKSKVLDEEHEQMVDPIREYLKGTRIRLTDSQRKEAASISGSYGAYRRDMLGRVKLVSTGGTELDVAWQELNEINPEWFPADATEGDMPGMLLAAKDALKPVYMTGMNTEENASWLAGKLNMEYLGLPAVKASARNQSGFTGSVRELRKTMARFEETSAEEFGEALRLLEESRKRSKDQTDREALAELRRQYDEWKAKDANEREERFQMELRHARDKIRANDLAMRRVYVQVLQKGYERQRSIDNEQRRERELVNKQRARTEATTRTLLNWLDKPTDAKHVPAGLEAPLNDVLTALDFGGKNTKVATQLSERLDKLATAIEGAQQQEDESRTTFLERDQQMVDELRRMAQLIKGNTEGRGVYDLKGAELKELNRWLGVVKHVLVNAGKMRGSNLNEDVKQVAAESIMEISRKKPMKDKKRITKEWEKHYGVDMMDSFTFFERLGRTSTEVFNGLRKGFDQMAGHVKQSEDYTKKLLDGVDLKNITGKKAEKLTFEIEKTGRKIEMTRAQIMELYVLNKREQARGHIYGDGIRIRGDEDAHAHAVTQRDVAKITSVLTDEEKKIADGLQKFLSKECAKWGNEASLKLLGYEKFGEENYWPISTDPNTRNTTRLEDNFAANINAIKNQGMTKQLIEGASNTIMIGDVFDTYTRHISNMAAYASYAVPLSDFDRWYNSRGVKVEIANVMGDKGNQYIKNLLMSINGTAQKAEASDVGKIAGAFTRNAKTAAVAANVRVAIQQPTSYARAAMYISPKYLTAALGKKLENAELVDKYCGIAAWKRYGFYETNIGPNLREMIVGDRTTAEKLRELSMQPAAMGDNWTLNQLWKACELETDEMMPELAKGTEEYYQHVGQRMSEIVDRTQVVDSPFHRSQMMRSKNMLDQMLTNFMSEPTKTFNMLTSAIYDYAENRNSPAAKKRLARAFATWGATAVLTAAAAAVVDAFRDGDDEKEWLERYKDALLGNALDGLNPLGMLPGIKDVLELWQGYEPSRLDQQSIQRIVWAVQEIGKYMNGESKQNLYGVTYKVAQAVSSTLGIPVSNVMRDLNAIVRSAMGVDPTKNAEAQKGTYVEKLINAMRKGDEKTATQLRGKLRKDAGMSPKDIDTVIADRLSYDERIAQAWTAKKEGRVGDVNRTKNALAHEGFTGEMVDRAIIDYGNREEPKEKKEKDMDAQLTAKLYSYDDAMNAVNKGASIDDIKAMMSEMVADSTAKYPGEAVKSEMQSRIKKEYMAAYEKGDTAKMDSLTMVLKETIGTKEETIAKWKAEKSSDNLKNAVDQYDGKKAKTAVAELRKSGKTDAQIKSSLSQYKEMYIYAVRSGDRQTAQKIKGMLMGLGLKGKNGKPLYTDDTFANWVK